MVETGRQTQGLVPAHLSSLPAKSPLPSASHLNQSQVSHNQNDENQENGIGGKTQTPPPTFAPSNSRPLISADV